MSQRNPYQEAKLGREAEELLNHPLLVDAFDKMEEAYLSAWRGSKLPDLEERERLWLAVQVLAEVRNHLRVVVENGVVANKEIERISGRR